MSQYQQFCGPNLGENPLKDFRRGESLWIALGSILSFFDGGEFEILYAR